jgi:PAS domain S-box-containing protein
VFDEVDRPGFREFVKPFLSRNLSIQALEWIPRIPDSQRKAYEKGAQLDGFPKFQITERKAQGEMVRASRRAEYFPVYFVEPYQGNESALGFDLASNAKRKEALTQSRDSGERVATERITLVQETGEQFGFLIFLPVYRKGVAVNSIVDRRKHLKGFVLGVFRVGDIVEKALTYLTREGIDVLLYDLSAPVNEQFLYFHAPRTRQALKTSPDIEQASQSPAFSYTHTLDVGGRKWEIRCTTTSDFVAAGKTWQHWGAFLLFLICTGILSASYFSKTRHTAQLSTAYQVLKTQIKEREKVEQALRQSEEKYRQLVNHAPAGLLEIDIPTKRLLSVNDVVCEYTGYTREELLSMSPLDMLTEESQRRFADRLGRHLAGERVPDTVDYKLRNKSGQELIVLCKIGLCFNHEGKPIKITVIVHDITKLRQAEKERKKLESQLIQSQKMEAIGTLAGGVAHDFNNLLTAIIGHADLSLMMLEEDHPLRTDVGEIKDAAERAASLTRQLLAFSRKQIIEPEPLNLNESIEGMEKMLRRLIGENIEMSVILGRDLGTIHADPGQIDQVIMNLVVNARDALPQGGKLTIETAHVELELMVSQAPT